MSSQPYRGRRASLLTQHGKESVITPVILDRCGCEVLHTQGFDTDQLGTFTREIPRAGSLLDAARKKARIGMQLTGLKLGIASEGALGADPYVGLLPWNHEVVILIDDTLNIEITGLHSAPAQAASALCASWPEVITFLETARFPEHQLVLRPDHPNHAACIKGIASLAQLKSAFDEAMRQSNNRTVFLENDQRAHTNPTRMASIQRAAQNLAHHMNAVCPACACPGFSVREIQTGLPCAACGEPTSQAVAKIWSCLKCGQTHTEPFDGPKQADPSRCPACNP